MTNITEVKLPGLGVRFEFTTENGSRVGVVCHRSGRRELYIADQTDPDTSTRMLDLSEDEARTLGEVLGGSRIARDLGELQQRVEGLAIDWLPVREGSPYDGRAIGAAQVRTRTGVSIVAVIRGELAIPAPTPDVELAGGDYLVVVGTARGIEEVVELLHNG
jgi:K+:H+ antiporter subunit KhtT